MPPGPPSSRDLLSSSFSVLSARSIFTVVSPPVFRPACTWAAVRASGGVASGVGRPLPVEQQSRVLSSARRARPPLSTTSGRAPPVGRRGLAHGWAGAVFTRVPSREGSRNLRGIQWGRGRTTCHWARLPRLPAWPQLEFSLHTDLCGEKCIWKNQGT